MDIDIDSNAIDEDSYNGDTDSNVNCGDDTTTNCNTN